MAGRIGTAAENNIKVSNQFTTSPGSQLKHFVGTLFFMIVDDHFFSINRVKT